jgi:hypothetical protein
MRSQFEKVTATQIEETWARYGDGRPLKEGFSQWMADFMNKEEEPPIPELIRSAVMLHLFTMCGIGTWSNAR